MKMRKAFLPTTLGLCLGLVSLLAGCAGPERAPRQPIKGVDTHEHKVDNPHDKTNGGGRTVDAAPAPREQAPVAAPTLPPDPSRHAAAAPAAGRGDLLSDFVAKIAAAHRQSEGIVAVFPALSRAGEREGRSFVVNGLGEWLMTETADGLEREGVRGVLSGASLVNDLKATNRGLDAWRGLDDVYWMADRIGAAYVVFGTAYARTFDRMTRDESLDLVWECRRTSDREVIATVRERLGDGATANQLYRYYRLESDWRIGADAPTFQPSFEAEFRILAQQLAMRIAAKHGRLLDGKGVRMAPTTLKTTAGVGAGLQDFASQFDRAFAAAERKFAAEGRTDAETATLESGPVRIAGQSYETFGAALDGFREKLTAYKASPAGALALDISRNLAERLRAATNESFRILPDDSDREMLLGIIRSEARAYRAEGAVDEQTLAALRARGTDLLLESTLRPALSAYQMRVVIRDLRTGAELTEAVDVDEMFKADLDRILGR